jgi:hypothetical protein
MGNLSLTRATGQGILCREMIVIGDKELPGAEAERRFGGLFAAWRMELLRGQWADWPVMQRHYPKARRLDGGMVHFPLAPDGSGIACAVCFKPAVIRLRHIVPAPQATRSNRPTPLSHPNNRPQPHAKTI